MKHTLTLLTALLLAPLTALHATLLHSSVSTTPNWPSVTTASTAA